MDPARALPAARLQWCIETARPARSLGAQTESRGARRRPRADGRSRAEAARGVRGDGTVADRSDRASASPAGRIEVLLPPARCGGLAAGCRDEGLDDLLAVSPSPGVEICVSGHRALLRERSSGHRSWVLKHPIFYRILDFCHGRRCRPTSSRGLRERTVSRVGAVSRRREVSAGSAGTRTRCAPRPATRRACRRRSACRSAGTGAPRAGTPSSAGRAGGRR